MHMSVCVCVCERECVSQAGPPPPCYTDFSSHESQQGVVCMQGETLPSALSTSISGASHSAASGSNMQLGGRVGALLHGGKYSLLYL